MSSTPDPSGPSRAASIDIATAAEGKILQNAKAYLLDDGRLLAGYVHNRYASDAVIDDIEKCWMVSEDRGATWEGVKEPPADIVCAADTPPTRALPLADGTLLAAGSCGWENFEETPERRAELKEKGLYVFDSEQGNAPRTLSIIHRAWMMRSRDRGRSWEYREISLPVSMAHLANYGDPVVLDDGTFVLPMWGRYDLSREPRYVSSLVLLTSDGGNTWDVRTVAKADAFDFNETSIVQAANGDVVAVMRTTRQRDLWTAVSTDRGRSWSAPRDSLMRGSTPWVVRNRENLLVSVYARRSTTAGGGEFPGTGMYACVSGDHGATWDHEHQVCIRDAGGESVDGYPGAVALPDGSVFAVYGWHGARTIGGTRF